MLITDNAGKIERGRRIVYLIMQGLNLKSQSPLGEIIQLSLQSERSAVVAIIKALIAALWGLGPENEG